MRKAQKETQGKTPAKPCRRSIITAHSASMEMYQREVVALIVASGSRLCVLHVHRLIDLWREYSQRQYDCCWVEADREEVYRFITWSNNQERLRREIIERARVRNMERLRDLGRLSLPEAKKQQIAKRRR